MMLVTPILAEAATPDPMALASWLACFLFVIAGYNQVMKAVDRMKDKPAPSEVLSQAHATFATQQELVRVESKVDSIDEDVKAFRAEVVANGEKRRDFITKHVSEQTQFLQRQINDLPGSIIATLRNAGHIK